MMGISAHKTDKNCYVCGSTFTSNVYNQLTCSIDCRKVYRNQCTKAYNKTYYKAVGKYKKICKVCNKSFIFKHHSEVTCSPKCKRINKLQVSYKLLDGDWDKYLQSLCRNRKELHRQKQFTSKELKKLLIQQNYKCALSGETLTCIVKRNIGDKKRNCISTNVSIDRINSNKGYTLDNVQLVCHAINIAKAALKQEEYMNWCRKVINYMDAK